ncbi:MAG: transcriptional regulator [bacterium]|nr:transcriptional regulator [bacterium]
MNQQPESEMNYTELPRDLSELKRLVDDLPEAQAERMRPLVENVSDSVLRRRRILSLVQEALSQLRLDMKYLLFDLEATKQERDAYRERLND